MTSPALRPARPGAPESRLTAGAAAQLPGSTPPPPWSCRVEAVLWWQRATPAARSALGAALPDALADRPVLAVVGGVVRYLDSPVGPYEELVGGVLLRPLLLHVPFLAVDSAASAHGGRAHWALPKTLAELVRTGPHEVVATGDGWRVQVAATPVGPRLPVAGGLPGRQLDDDGRPVPFTAAARGSGRLARVLVRVGSDRAGEPGSLAGWLRSGRHPGAVVRLALRVGGGRPVAR